MSHHLISVGLGVHDLVLAATSSSKKTTSASADTFIFLILIVGLGYVLLVRGPRQRARRAQQQQSSIGIGDEVMLTSGIVGRIVGLRDDRAQLEIAPGVEIEVIRAALGRKLSDGEGVPESEEEYEPAGTEPGADGSGWPHPSDELHYGEHDEGDEAETGAEEGDGFGAGTAGAATGGGEPSEGSESWPATAVHPDRSGTDVPGGGLGGGGADTGSTPAEREGEGSAR